MNRRRWWRVKSIDTDLVLYTLNGNLNQGLHYIYGWKIYINLTKTNVNIPLLKFLCGSLVYLLHNYISLEDSFSLKLSNP